MPQDLVIDHGERVAVVRIAHDLGGAGHRLLLRHLVDHDAFEAPQRIAEPADRVAQILLLAGRDGAAARLRGRAVGVGMRRPAADHHRPEREADAAGNAGLARFGFAARPFRQARLHRIVIAALAIGLVRRALGELRGLGAPRAFGARPIDLLDASDLPRRQRQGLRHRAERIAVRTPTHAIFKDVAARQRRRLVAGGVAFPLHGVRRVELGAAAIERGLYLRIRQRERDPFGEQRLFAERERDVGNCAVAYRQRVGQVEIEVSAVVEPGRRFRADHRLLDPKQREERPLRQDAFGIGERLAEGAGVLRIDVWIVGEFGLAGVDAEAIVAFARLVAGGFARWRGESGQRDADRPQPFQCKIVDDDTDRRLQPVQPPQPGVARVLEKRVRKTAIDAEMFGGPGDVAELRPSLPQPLDRRGDRRTQMKQTGEPELVPIAGLEIDRRDVERAAREIRRRRLQRKELRRARQRFRPRRRRRRTGDQRLDLVDAERELHRRGALADLQLAADLHGAVAGEYDDVHRRAGNHVVELRLGLFRKVEQELPRLLHVRGLALLELDRPRVGGLDRDREMRLGIGAQNKFDAARLRRHDAPLGKKPSALTVLASASHEKRGSTI